ncbi:acyl-CoA-like ligand-binding transcription factor [Curtobacterium aurantiacum]|uniref:TetR family transcriptional regulator n=1 Tax=Curtobacterium aurantiacum TaxID=3236919 RepID=A0ABS5VGM1_9MICO|nr:TetR family transcriptional regulator [Curtobacterium flaccumfaciens]MBT1545528.1 TetR family transcriptional regulator [Curtobacterium flaccumfaciens pv. flaccumfaciens]MBT1588644.1 TetR family transcriptional regulator [Curtobacterium flaccumfaciens pv. flaccumfaciens]
MNARPTDPAAKPGLRDIARDAVRARVAEVAIARFDADGFDQVTVEQIAAEVGISARSFHRYFPAKEDTVIGDPGRHREALAAAFRSRPADEPVWTALREAFADLVSDSGGEDTETARRSIRVMTSTASLRARNLEKHNAWAEVLTPLVAERLAGPGVDLRARTLVQAALGCFDVAIAEWAVGDEPDAVRTLHRTFDVIRPTDRGTAD